MFFDDLCSFFESLLRPELLTSLDTIEEFSTHHPEVCRKRADGHDARAGDL